MPKPPITTFSSLNLNNRNPNFKDLGLYAPELTQTEINEIPSGTLRNGAIVTIKMQTFFSSMKEITGNKLIPVVVMLMAPMFL